MERSRAMRAQIFDFVKSACPDAVVPYADGVAFDVFVPSKSFGIEFNSLYAHSEKFVPDDYHEKKLAMAREANVKLFNVFEDEWRDKRVTIESMILSRLGLASAKVQARKCELVELGTPDRKKFFSGTHIDGDCNSTTAFGLVSEGDVVAALSLRRPFHKKWGEMLEIGRFAIRRDTSVQGALSRLAKAANARTKSMGRTGMLSYVDLGHGDGHSYEAVGFK